MAEWWETKPGDPAPESIPPIARPEIAAPGQEWWMTRPEPLQAAPPAPERIGWERALHGGEVFGSGLAAGALAPVDLAFGGLNWLGNKTGYWDPRATPGERLAPYLASPENTAERLVYGAGSGIGSLALPAGIGTAARVAGGGAALPALARLLLPAPTTAGGAAATLAAGAGGGVGAQIGSELMPDHPLIGAIAGGLAGGMAPGILAGGTGRAATAAGLMTPRTTPMSQAYEATGITPATAADVTQNPLVQMLAATSARLPGGGPIPHAVEQTAGQFGQAVEGAAQRLGTAQTKIEAGGALQKAANDYLDMWRRREAAAWNGLAVPGNQPVDVSPVIRGLQLRLGQYPGAPKLAASQTNTELRRLYDDLVADTGPGGRLQWQAAKNLRSDIGAKIGGGTLAPDRDLAALNQIYGNLTNGMEGAAAQAGAGSEFAAARAISREGHDFLDNGGRAIINATPEAAVDKAFSGVGRGGGSMLSDIRAMRPDAADDLAAYHLRQIVTPPPGQASAAVTASPGTFLTGLNRLSKEARRALFADPAVAAQLADLKTVAEGIRGSAQRLPNPSGSAAGIAHAAPWLAIPPAYFAGGLRGALATASPILGNYALSRALTSPAAMRFAQGPERGYPVVPSTAAGFGVGGAVPRLIQLMAGQ